MSVAAPMADAFFREVLEGGLVYTVRDNDGYPAPMNGSGVRAMPFWSKRSRAQRIVDSLATYQGFRVEEMSRDEWERVWWPRLGSDGCLVGLNWSGPRAVGSTSP
jgi:hypothetical protein